MAVLSIEEHRQIFVQDLESAKLQFQKNPTPTSAEIVRVAERVLANFERTRGGRVK